MLKLNASFSKKIPAEQEYSSQSYHCSIEIEIPDGVHQDELRQRIHDTFVMVRSTVEDELRNAPGNRATLPPLAAPLPISQQQAPQQTGNGFQRASNKQIKYLLDLAKRDGKDIRWVTAEVQRRFQVQTVYEVSKQQASILIDDLAGNQRAA